MINLINTALVRAVDAAGSLRARLAEERGQDLLEYALLGGVIAAGIVAVAVLFNGALTSMVNNIGDCIDFDAATACTPGP